MAEEARRKPGTPKPVAEKKVSPAATRQSPPGCHLGAAPADDGVEDRDRQPERVRSAGVQWASSIQPRRQVWLWQNRIPMGTASALAGRGGTGKTTYAFHLIAQISRGTLPGTHQGSPKPSLIWSGEDEWDKVIIPRLIAANADLSKVGRLVIESCVDGKTREVAPKVPMDMDAISGAIEQTGAVLVLIDPIASTMTGDLNREADVRSAVDALARVGQATGAVMMFVRHFGKGGGNASDKMSGSHAFRDAVRSVFLFAPDEDRVIVTQDKGNYAPPGEGSFAFRLDSVSVPTIDGFTDVARVLDLGASDTSVGDIINRTDANPGDRDDIDRWLTDLLANGSVKANEVYAAADAAGYSKDQAKRAKKRLGISAIRETGDGPWFWRLETKGAGDQGSTPDAREAAPLLPCTSTEVHERDSVPRERRAQERSLGTPSPASMPPKKAVKPPRQRVRTIAGEPAPNCPHCGEQMVYADDRRDGYHTSKAECVKAQQQSRRAS
ncbi:AAA family ATPase [Mycobacteroides abscessus]|nr:AAA family ATPase [Mycobacteroides abscessus]